MRRRPSLLHVFPGVTALFIQRWYNTIPLRGGTTDHALLEMRFGATGPSSD